MNNGTSESTVSLLFLDIDGVLRGLHTKASPYKRAAIERMGIHDARTQLELTLLDWYLVQQLCAFVTANNIKVVVTSTWREGWESEHFTELFRLCGAELANDCIIGCTPLMDEISETSKRGHEIKAYLDDTQRKRNYAILDDQGVKAFLPEQYERLVSTCPYKGLLASDLDKVLGHFA
tara:strand:- start:223919 stop:224452 length:534 start_codon:yes stop_codon:yes gene_type:complete